jgi:hypothetical protein
MNEEYHDVRNQEEPAGTAYTRWSSFEKEVLEKVNNPVECRKLILLRQEEIDDEADEADLVASYFRQIIRMKKHDPDHCCVYWPTAEIVDVVAKATGEKKKLTKVTPYLKELRIPELAYTHKNGAPGWIWRGHKASVNKSSAVFSTLGLNHDHDDEEEVAHRE